MWHKITLNQFLELREVENTSYDSNIDKMVDMLSIVEDKDPIELEELSFNEITNRFKKLEWLTQEPPKTFRKQIKELHFKELNNLSLAEYIDLSYFFEEDYLYNLPNICGILYRSQNVNKWSHKIIEPYDYDPKERAEEFLELPVTHVFGVVHEFIKFKETFENTYAPLFQPEFDTDEDYEETEEDKLEEDKKRFSWEHFIYNLCSGDLTKADEVLNLQLIFVFNMLAMRNTFGD